MENHGDDFLSGILSDGQADHVSSLDDLTFPLTQQETHYSPEVEVVGSRGNKGAKRSKKFNVHEDELICIGWLIASKDPIHGANQNRTGFWGKVHAHFEMNNKCTTPRTESSILHRWLTIQALVNKFCSCYEAITRRKQSGTTIQDEIAAAMKMFLGVDNVEGKKCSVVNCWNILKGEDKWKTRRNELLEQAKEEAAIAAGKKTRKKPTKVSRPREEEGTNNGNEKEDTNEAAAANAETGGKKRSSEGVKKAKANLRRGGAEACLEAIDTMWAKKEVADNEKEKAKQERFMLSYELDKQSLQLEKKRAEAEDKRAEADLMKQEKDIMLADMTNLNTIQRQWLDIMQKDILAKRSGNAI